MFNLRQLMLLQQERLDEEQRVAREQRRAKAQARLQRIQLRRAAEAQRRREAEEAARRARVERETALRRVELEVAAAHEERGVRTELKHTRELARIEAQRRARLTQVWRRGAVLATLACVLAGGSLGWALQRSAAADAQLQRATASAARQALELDDLRDRLAALASAGKQTKQPVQPPSAAPPSASHTPAKPRRRSPRLPRPRPRDERAGGRHVNDAMDPMGSLDNDSLDPIEGL